MRQYPSRTVVTVVDRADVGLPESIRDLPLEDYELRRALPADLEGAMPGTEVMYLWAPYSRDLERCWHLGDSLKWIHVGMSGVDNMMFDELAHSDVAVTNARGVLSEPIAEFVVGAILIWSKRLLESVHDTVRQRFNHREVHALSTARVLVVGTGSIGRETARLLRALGVSRVDGAGRQRKAGDERFDTIISTAELADGIGHYDAVVVAVPGTTETAGMIGEQVLTRMKDDSVLVNVGRGTVVDTEALTRCLETQNIMAVLDVTEPEPLPADHRMWRLPNVIISPHMSGDFYGRHEANAELFLENLERYSRGQSLRNQVDKAAALP